MHQELPNLDILLSLHSSDKPEKVVVEDKKSLMKNLGETFKNKFTEFKMLPVRFHLSKKQARYVALCALDIMLFLTIVINGITPAKRLLSPLVNIEDNNLHSLTEGKKGYEVLGFAPFWTINKLANVDFKTLTTLAYFGVDVQVDGSLDREGSGYQTFTSKQATEIFKKAHENGTRVVLTVTQMENSSIRAIMDSEEAKKRAIEEISSEVTKRGIDGVNVDFEYSGNPGLAYRQKFSAFVKDLSDKIHKDNPASRVTVSVYASAIKEPKIYDIASLSKDTDGIFMMAYDFAVASSDNAIPTAPLYGYKAGKYWYDISTAVEDFLKVMPSSKLVLGVPYYGYNYPVYEPEVKATTTPQRATAQTYTIATDSVKAEKSGWDEQGQVGWKAYVSPNGTWRMIFMDDPRSLSIKYDFAKEKKLAGVGVWALGFDDGKNDLWAVLKDKFGNKDLANNQLIGKEIFEP